MAKRPSAHSTEGRAKAPPALRCAPAFDELAGDLVPIYAKLLHVGATDAAVRAALADDAAIAARLVRVPPAALAVLERIVDADGDIGHDELASLARRVGLTITQMLAALSALERECLVTRVRRTLHNGRTFQRIVILDIAAESIASRVRGLTIPAPPASATTESTPDPNLRDLVALIASAVHVPVRTRQFGGANRTTVKKLAAIVGWSDARVGGHLDAAIAGGVLASAGSQLVPIRPKLLALARRELVLGGDDARVEQVRAWASSGWIARDALMRATLADGLWRIRHSYPHSVQAQAAGGEESFVEVEGIVDEAGLEQLTYGGHVFLRAPRAHSSGHGDGHVTPSFEVMLGPAADPELVVTLALATEPGRMDLVLTRRITPASITAAFALGISAPEILDALARVGRHGVPDNVRMMVEDWTRGARTVRIRRAWALEASSAEAADAMVRALGPEVVGRPSPTVVLVRGELVDPAPLLAKSGVRVVSEPAAGASPRDPVRSRPGERPAVLDARPDEMLRAHYESGRERGHPELDLVEQVPSRDPVVFAPSELIDEIASALPFLDKRARRLLATASRLWKGAEAEYAAWAEMLEPAQRDEALAVGMAAPLDVLPWLALLRGVRTGVRQRARSAEELVVLASKVATNHRALSPDGKVALRIADDPEVAEVVAALEVPDEEAPRRVAPPAAGVAPPASALRAQGADEVRARFADAASRGIDVWLRVSSKTGGDRVLPMRPERILERGLDVALLGVDPETEQNRSFPLGNVLCVAPC